MPDMNFDVIAFAGSETGVVVMIVLVGLLMAIVGGMFWYFKKGAMDKFIAKFPVRVVIFEKRGDGIIPTALDWGRALTLSGGKNIYQLKGRGDKMQAPEYDALTPNNWLFLFSPARGEYHPMMLKPVDGTIYKDLPVIKVDEQGNPLKNADGSPVFVTDQKGNIAVQRMATKIPIAQLQPIMSESMKYVYADSVRSTFQRFYKPDFFEKFMPILVILALCIGIMIILWAVLGQMKPLFEMGSAVANNCGAVLSAAHPAAATAIPPPA